jgi:hypothetical protein
MKKYFQSIVSIIALAMTAGYLYYLYSPLVEQEFAYFVSLPSALAGLIFFTYKNIFDFVWVGLLALAGLGISFLVFEKVLKLRLPAGFMLGVGLGFLGLIVFLMGALHLLHPNLIRALVSILALPGIIFSFARSRSLKIGGANLGEILIVILFAIPVLMVLVHPTYFYDALYYHLALPRQYLLRNSIAPIPSISYSYFPEIAEMIYLAGLAVSGQVAAQMINFLFWISIILLGRELFAELFGVDRKIFSTVSLLALPIFCYISFLISNDIIVGFFILAGAYVLIKEELSLKNRAILFGLTVGLACSVKLNAYLYMLFPQTLWLVYLIFKQDRKQFLKTAAASLAGFIIICAPFWTRNVISTGNPLFPALTSMMGGPLSEEQSKAIAHDAHAAEWSSTLVKEVFSIPHEFVYFPVQSKSSGMDKTRTLPFPLIGAVLPAGLLLLLLKKPENKLIPVLIYCLAFYLLWALSFRLARFAMGLWIMLAVLSAGGFSMLWQKGKPYNSLAVRATHIAFFVGLVLALLAGARTNGWNMLTRRLSAQEYLRKISSVHPVQMGAYPVYEWLNRNSGADEQTALLGPTSFFYLERKALANSYIDENPLIQMFNLGKSPEEVCMFLGREKIGYLVFQPGEIERLSKQYPANQLSETGKARMDQFMTSPCLEQVMSSKTQQIYLFKVHPLVF